MNVVYIWIAAYSPFTFSPPLADLASCEAIRALRKGDCVQVVIPTPSDKAYYNLPNKIGPTK
jgi:hypothetical protein